jgi:putative DNA primase/helicase
MSAGEIWRSAVQAGESAYLKRKAVQAEACRFLPDGSIVVPLLRYDAPRESALRAVQRIWPDGRKRFTRGFEKAGCSLRLGLVTLGETILVCEGYATGLTLRMATSRRVPVFVALDAGNLAPVCRLLRDLYPACPLLICADDDWRTHGPDGAALNVGRAKAHQVSREIERVSVTYPAFRIATRGDGDTDFNDLHCRDGLPEVARQMRWVLRHLSPALFGDVPALAAV